MCLRCVFRGKRLFLLRGEGGEGEKEGGARGSGIVGVNRGE